MNVAKIAIMAMCVALGATGCASVTPKVITVPSVRYVPIPAELDADCPIPTLADRTVGGAIELAIRLKTGLIQCNDKLAGIRAIQGEVK